MTDYLLRTAERIHQEFGGSWPKTYQELAEIKGWTPQYARRVFLRARKAGLVEVPPPMSQSEHAQRADAARICIEEHGWSEERTASVLGYPSIAALKMAVLRRKRRTGLA